MVTKLIRSYNDIWWINPRTGFFIVLLIIVLPITLSSQIAVPVEGNEEITKAVQETIWLDTDRSIYIAGEEIIISASVLELDSYVPSRLSDIIYVEILDGSGKALVRGKYKLQNGSAAIIIETPISLTNNYYWIRAYTKWMRNFSMEEFALCPIKIISTIPLRENDDVIIESSINIELSPEWGQLIEGRINKTAIYISDEYNQGIQARGFLLNSSSDTIVSFSSDITGWSSIDWTPSADEDYRITIEGSKDYRLITRIPPIFDDAPDIQLSNDRRNHILTFYPPSSGRYTEVNLLLHGLYTKYWLDKKSIDLSGKVTFVIPNSILPDGIFQFSLYDESGSIIAKRLYSLSYPSDNLNPEITLKDLSPGLNSTLEIEFSFPDNNTNEGLGTLSRLVSISGNSEGYKHTIPGMSGWKICDLIPYEEEAFSSWLIANSYPDNIINEFIQELGIDDKEMEGQSAGFKPEEVKVNIFLSETSGVSMTGVVRNEESGSPASNINLSLSFLNSTEFYSTKTNGDGAFFFSFPDKLGREDIIVSFIGNPELNLNAIIENDYEESIHPLPDRKFFLTQSETEFLKKININMQLSKIYTPHTEVNSAKDMSVNNDRDSLEFYGIPDRVVRIGRYIDLLNLREILYEIIPGVFARLEGDRYIIYLQGDYPFLPNYSPLVMVDGIPFRDFNSLLELEPSLFKSIDVKYAMYFHGNNAFAGIVNFKSVNNDLGGLSMPEDSKLISYEFETYPEKFKSENAGNLGLNTSFITNTLWFDRFRMTDYDKLVLSGSDVPGEYSCRIYGFDKYGRWINVEKRFKVLNK